MIDNFDQIRDALVFDVTGMGYYFLEILARRKDFPPGADVKDRRVYGTYFITSREMLDRIEPEVKLLCSQHNARAYINMSMKSMRTTTMLLMRGCLDMVENSDYHRLPSRLASAAGQCPGVKSFRRFLVDVDSMNIGDLDRVRGAVEKSGGEIVLQLETPGGWHLVTQPFNVGAFNENAKEDLAAGLVTIKHNSPTVLFYAGKDGIGGRA